MTNFYTRIILLVIILVAGYYIPPMFDVPETGWGIISLAIYVLLYGAWSYLISSILLPSYSFEFTFILPIIALLGFVPLLLIINLLTKSDWASFWITTLLFLVAPMIIGSIFDEDILLEKKLIKKFEKNNKPTPLPSSKIVTPKIAKNKEEMFISIIPTKNTGITSDNQNK